MNEKHYQGKPCKYGHDGLRYKASDSCVECQKQRWLREKTDPIARERKLAKDREYYQQHKDDLLAQAKQYREENLERLKEVGRVWREASREQRSERRRKLWTVLDKVGQRLVVIKARAKKKGQEFTITPDDCPPVSHCPVFGIELDWAATGQQPNSPSLDRFDNTKGYVPGNVHWISWRANNAKNSSTVDELEQVIKWMKSLQDDVNKHGEING